MLTSNDTDAMVADLRRLVECESPSMDIEATARCADLLAALGEERLGQAPERIRTGERTNLLWRWGPAPSTRLILGHLDTVWPLGTLARWPFTVEGDRATGPGAFDMKAGLVQALYAVASLSEVERDGVAILVTADEEIGSPDTRGLIEALAWDADEAFVPEASAPGEQANGALKIERKGVSLYSVVITGRAAHAGLEPERGVNASIELAHQVLALATLGDPALGTTVTPTVLASGTTTNTVPAGARIEVDVRVCTVAEQDRVDAAIRALRPHLDGAQVTIEGGPNRPPLERKRTARLFHRAQEAYAALGLGDLEGVAVGGASDGNFTAGVGTDTLDGIGAVGGGAHAEGEWVSVPDLWKRAALLASLVRPHDQQR